MSSLQHLQHALDEAAEAFRKQNAVVRNLTFTAELDSKEMQAAERRLKELKRRLYNAKKAVVDGTPEEEHVSSFNRAETEKILENRFFTTPSFGIYGDFPGFYDYGPPGTFLCSVNAFFERMDYLTAVC